MPFIESLENLLILRVISPLLNGELSNIEELKEIFILPLLQVSNSLHLQTGDVALSLAVAPLMPKFLKHFVLFSELIAECAIFYERLDYQVKLPNWLVLNETLILDLFDNDRKRFYDLVWLEANSFDVNNVKDFNHKVLRSLKILASKISFLRPVEIEQILHDLMRGNRKLSIFLSNIFGKSSNNCFTLREIHGIMGSFFRQGALNLDLPIVNSINRNLKLFISEFEEEIKPTLFEDFTSVSQMREGIVSRLMVYMLSNSSLYQKGIQNLKNSSFTSQQARFLRENLKNLNMNEINFLYDKYFNFTVEENEDDLKTLNEGELEAQILVYQSQDGSEFEEIGLESNFK